MNTQTVKLDVTKRPAVMPTIYIGQGDKNGTTLVADIYDDGAALDLTSYDVKFRMKLPYDTAEYNVSGTVSGSTATFAIDEQYAASVAGITDVAYVEVLSGSTVICSTNRMRVVVLESAFEGVDPATIYDNGLNDAIDRAIAAAEAAEGVVLQDVPTMTANIKGGAKLGSGLDVTNSVLSLDLVDSATGMSVTADDASYLASLTVDGKAVQNGTPTPSSPVEIQTVSLNLNQNFNSATNNVVYKSNCNYAHSSGRYTLTSSALNNNAYMYINLNPQPVLNHVYYVAFDFVSRSNDSFNIWSKVGGSNTTTYNFNDGPGRKSYIQKNTVAGSSSNTFIIGSTNKSGAHVASGVEIVIDNIVHIDLTLMYGAGNEPSTVEQFESVFGNGYFPYDTGKKIIAISGASTPTVIDLQGNVLASLPDGTKDELTVDSSGHVVLTKRVGKLVLAVSDMNNSDSWPGWPNCGARAIVGAGLNAAIPANEIYCNVKSGNGIFSLNSTGQSDLGLMPPATYGLTQTQWQTNYPNMKIELLLKYATPQTIDLGYIDMPAIPDGATISITAQVTPTITASWWARGAAAIAEAIKSLRDNVLARIEAIETAIAEL